MTREDIVGTEFDWVAADSADQIGIFATSGFGPIPEFLEGQLESYSAKFVKALDDVIRIPDWADFLTYKGEIPIFVYDWAPTSGPYRRVRIPRGADPLRIEDFPEEIQRRIIRLELSFDTVNEISAVEIDRFGEQAEDPKPDNAPS